MHVDKDQTARRTKMVATLGVMAAISVILLVLGTLISINTAFFTAMAAFLVGIAVVKYGFGPGTMLFLGCAVLDLILNPEKLHVLLYVAMGGFILVSEGSYRIFEKRIMDPKKRNLIHLICRFAFFMAAYCFIVFLLPRLILSGEAIEQIFKYDWSTWAMLAGGIICFFAFDLAYIFVKRTYLHLFSMKNY